MTEEKFLVDVGMKDLPFPIKAISSVCPEGQGTIASISINARIMHEFEARWIDTFIRIVHQHRGKIGTKTLKVNIAEYLKQLNASAVRVDFDYPFFVEKSTPVSKENCLVRYLCRYSAKTLSAEKDPTISFKMDVPIVTTYPISTKEPKSLFGQLSVVNIDIESQSDIYPENIVELVDKHALAPVYSFLTEADQSFLIDKIHSEKKTSVVVVDEIRAELARDGDIDHYSISCFNFGMLHSYSTVIGTEKSMWVPFSGYETEEI
ncbi:MAG: GTP cyclohydrolase I FolE2 [Sedimentisphaerales bacterium]|nr:GTP cyclohydrolase I FolE2 [Sedimentisphaerales bacterium]